MLDPTLERRARIALTDPFRRWMHPRYRAGLRLGLRCWYCRALANTRVEWSRYLRAEERASWGDATMLTFATCTSAYCQDRAHRDCEARP